MSARYARVAFNVRARRLFDYRLPSAADSGVADGVDGAEDITGRRVLAPFGSRNAIGVVISTSASTDIAADKIKPLTHIYDDMPPLPPTTLALIQFCADYYHSPIGIAAASALPAFFRRENTYQPPAGYRLRDDTNADTDTLSGNARTVHALLADGMKTVASIRRHVAHPQHALKKLLDLGIIERCHVWEDDESAAHNPVRNPTPAPAPTPSEQQQQTLAQLNLDSGFTPHLLFGATGSGKTEIYLRAAEQVLARGAQVLMLTPEIHLTPQFERTLRQRFPDHRIAVLHSNLPDGERARRWMMARLGHADIVLGTRLAVFTPMPSLGLIIVDEEHDDSFKQEEGLLFSARNVAVWRAKNEQLPLIAGSATPSLESMHNARAGNWTLLTMPARVSGTLPQVHIIGEQGGDYHGMDQRFVRELSNAIGAGEQCLVFINRRGYAPTLLCRSCNTAQQCAHCSSSMTVHRRRHLLICHLCGSNIPLPPRCTQCGGDVIASGSGTQRIEEALLRLFPDCRTLRIDSDASTAGTGGSGALAKHRDDIVNGDLQLMIGTQLIAKGHNFPRLSFIGILNADAGLAASDLRAEERLFALLSQVIGRGTRNPNGCRVFVQTRHPTHPFYQELQNDDVSTCWQRLLSQRQHSAMPPFAHLAILRGKDKNPRRLDTFMQDIVQRARAAAAATTDSTTTTSPTVRIFDPVAPPIERVSDWHRRQILLHARHRRPLHDFLDRFLPSLPAGGAGGSSWTIDIDPLNI